MKSVALSLAMSIAYAQLLWAADVRQLLRDAKASFLEDDQRRGMSAEEYAAFQQQNQGEVNQQNGIEEAMRFNLTTQSGDLLEYVGNKLQGVVRPDQTNLRNLSLAADGSIVSADLRLADGSVQILREGKVVGYERPDGSHVLYENGRITKVISRDEVETVYTYVNGPGGELSEIVLENAAYRAVYTPLGTLKETKLKSDNTVFAYEGGLLKEAILATGARLHFTLETLPGSKKLSFAKLVDTLNNTFFYTNQKLSSVKLASGERLFNLILTADGKGVLDYSVESKAGELISQEGATTHASLLPATVYGFPAIKDKVRFEYALYRENAAPQEIRDLAGNKLLFNEAGFLTQAIKPDGSSASFGFEESSLSNLLGATIVQNGVHSKYDATGRLSQVTFEGMTIHYKPASDEVDWIEKADGTELHGLVFGADGVIKDAEIHLPDGEVRIYKAGKLESVEKPDLTKILFFDSKPTKLLTSQKLAYNFTYTPGKIEAKLDASIVPQSDTTVTYEYDPAFNLKKAIRKNAEILSYLDNDLVLFEAPEKSPQVFTYTKDPAGKILSYKVTQGDTETFYDQSHQALRSVISPSEGNPNLIEAEYKYGKIREVKKNGTLTFKYSYEFDAQGAEYTVIEDLEEKAKKTYKEGLLLTSFAHETSVLSTYAYQSGKVSEVKVTRLGRALHTYSYVYQGENTLVTDEEGAVRTYSAQKKLLFLEKEGKTYKYSYSLNAQNQEIVEDELVKKKLKDGSTAHYLGGAVTKVERTDGKTLVDILLNEDRSVKGYTALFEDGSRKVFLNGVLIQETTPDGMRYHYDGGRISKAVDPQGVETLYEYVYKPNSSGEFHERSSGKAFELKGNTQIAAEGTRKGASYLKFDGSGDYLTFADSEDWNFGAQDATIDLWVKFDTVSGYDAILSQGSDSTSGMKLKRNGTGWWFSYGLSNAFVLRLEAADTLAANTWYHLAVVRSGSSVKLYRDGVLKGAASAPAFLPNYTGPLAVGTLHYGSTDHAAAGDSEYYFKGAIEELRVSKGAARWTSNFTPPSAAHASDTQTKLLLRGGTNEEILESVAVTRNGIRVVYLPGDTSLPYASRMNFERSLAGGVTAVYRFGELQSIVTTGTTTYTYSRWNIRGTRRTYVSKSGVTYRYEADLEGFELDGYLYAQVDELRLFSDESASRRVPSFFGDAKLDSSTLRQGDATLRFDGAGDYLQVPDSSDWTIGSGENATIDLWIKTDSTGGMDEIFSQGSDGTNYMDLRREGQTWKFFVFQNNSFAVRLEAPDALTANTWYHLALVREGTAWKLYRDGRLKGSASGPASMPNYSGPLTLGILYAGSTNYGYLGQDYYLHGSIDDFRFSKGVARWTGEFTPPSTSAASDSYTKLYIHEYLKSYQGTAYKSANGYIILNPEKEVSEYSVSSIGPQAAVFLASAESIESELPYESHLEGWRVLNPARESWASTATDAVLDAQQVVLQEYSADGTLETQAKADGTVTLFEKNKPSKVLDPTGNVLMEYSYDSAGYVSRVFLKNARLSLPVELEKARFQIEEGRASSLRALAVQRNVAYQDVEARVAGLKAQLSAQQATLEQQRQTIGGTKAKGKSAKNQKADALNQLDAAAGQVRSALTDILKQEADAYAALDSQVQAASNSVEADADRAYRELSVQESNLKKEILRQEVSPVIYDHYRRILGRDPSSKEYDTWIQKLDYDSGMTTEETVVETLVNGKAARLSGGHLEIKNDADTNFGYGDFTVDLWAKFETSTGQQTLVSVGNGLSSGADAAKGITLTWNGADSRFYVYAAGAVFSGASYAWTPAMGQWHHVALVRKNGELRLYADGAQVGQAQFLANAVTPTADTRIGQVNNTATGDAWAFRGKIDQVRFSKNARWESTFAPLSESYAPDSKTTLLLRADENGTYRDLSAFRRAVTFRGAAAVDSSDWRITTKKTTRTKIVRPTPLSAVISETVQEEFRAGKALRFDGDKDYALLDDSDDWSFGVADGTIDFWVKFDTLSGYDSLFSQGTDGSNYMSLNRRGSAWEFYAFVGNGFVVRLDAADTLTANTWHHVSLVKQGAQWKLYRDGVLRGSAAGPTSSPNYSSPLALGTLFYGTTDHGASVDANYYFQGSMDELRVSKGVARWTANFTPTTVRYEKDSFTKLLVRADAAGVVSDAALNRAVNLFGVRKERRSSWAGFDGAGDSFKIQDSDDWHFGAGAGTIDLWVKLDELGSFKEIFSQGSDGMNYMDLRIEGGAWKFSAFVGNAFVLRLEAPDSVSINTWYHLALVKEGVQWKLYRDGQLKGSATGPASMPNYTGPLALGTLHAGSTDFGYYLKGAIDEFRVSKGVSRWTGNFTPPGAAYVPDTQTKLLLRAEGTALTDKSAAPYAVTATGNAGVGTPTAKTAERIVTRIPTLKDFRQALEDYLNGLPELVERRAYVSGVKATVRQKIQSFLTMTLSEKTTFAASLGLTQGELVALTQSDAQKILGWLDTRSLHFGQSAFLSLESLLDQKGIAYAREDIAWKTIVVDILAGVISPLDDGDLVLSVFALQKTASLYGLSISGASLTYEDLLQLFATPNTRLVAHVNGNHFVILTNVTVDSVTYIDTAAGKDKENQVVTLPKDKFLSIWKGNNVFAETSKVAALANASQKILSAQESQKVRGAFFFVFVFAIATAIGSIAAAIGLILAQIGAVLAQIGQMVAGALQAIGHGLTSLMHGIGYVGNAIYSAVEFAFSSIFGAIKGAFATIGQQSFFGGLAKASFGEVLFQSIATIGVGYSTSKGLEALGVNPVITGVLSSFVSGGFLSIVNMGAFNLGHFAFGGLKASLLTGAETLLNHLGVDPMLSSALSLLTNPLADGLLSGQIGDAFVQFAPKLATNLSLVGLQKLGSQLGVDPRLSGLIGAPISAAIGANYQPGVNAGTTAINAINNGLLRGAVSLGMEYATQKANLNPLLSSLTSRAITGAIEGALGGGNIFQGIFKGFTDSALNIARLGVSGNDAWSQAQYLQRVINFSDIIRQKGLAKALEDTATQILHEDSISSILKSFQTVGAFIQDQITNNKTTTVVKGGKNYNRIQLSNGQWIDLDEGKLNIDELKIGNQTERGTFGVDAYGNFGLLNGYKTDQLDATHTVRYDFAQGSAVNIQVNDADNRTLLEIAPKNGDNAIRYNANGELESYSIETFQSAKVFLEVQDGEILNYSYYQPLDPFEFVLPAQEKDGFGFSVTKNSNGTYTTERTFSNTFRQIFKAGFQGADPFTVDGIKKAITLMLPGQYVQQMNLNQLVDTAQAVKNRYDYFTSGGFGYTNNEALAWALYDTAGDIVGFTPLLEGIYGVDTQSGKLLTGGERALKIGVGAVTILGNVFGGAAILHKIGFVPKVGSVLQDASTSLRTINTQLGEVGAITLTDANFLSAQRTVRVYRVEGTPNTRLILGESGEMVIQGDKTLFLNFGSRARAEEFLAQKIAQGMPGATIKSFEVPKSFLDQMKAVAVPEARGTLNPGRPIIVDITKAPNQLGLRKEQIELLKKNIISDTYLEQ